MEGQRFGKWEQHLFYQATMIFLVGFVDRPGLNSYAERVAAWYREVHETSVSRVFSSYLNQRKHWY